MSGGILDLSVDPVPPFLEKIRLNFQPPTPVGVPGPASASLSSHLNPGSSGGSTSPSLSGGSGVSGVNGVNGAVSGGGAGVNGVHSATGSSTGGGSPSIAGTQASTGSASASGSGIASGPGPGPVAGPGPSTAAQSTLPLPVPPNALYLPPPAVPVVEEDLVPPENFASVTSGVFRCGFPKKRNFKFMETLKLKTVLTLVLEDYPEANLKWCQSQDIQFMQFGIPGNKEPFDNIPEDVICSALVAILDRRNHPILIHCNKGKHRTGCLIGCIRRLQSWSLSSIFDEYRRFSHPKSRAVDQQFIDLFEISNVWAEVVSPLGGGIGYLPSWSMLLVPRQALEAAATAGTGTNGIARRIKGSETMETLVDGGDGSAVEIEAKIEAREGVESAQEAQIPIQNVGMRIVD